MKTKAHTPTLPPLFTREQVAGRYQVSLMTLHRWERAGKLIPVKFGSGTVRYTAKSLAQFDHEAQLK
jgi:predicted site-specific integrase-resolvase